MRGRMYIIDQAGDLYYDSGNPGIGIYAVRCLGAGHVGGMWGGHVEGMWGACGGCSGLLLQRWTAVLL